MKKERVIDFLTSMCIALVLIGVFSLLAYVIAVIYSWIGLWFLVLLFVVFVLWVYMLLRDTDSESEDIEEDTYDEC